MKLISINVSLPQTVIYQGKPVSTGIFKKPVSARVMLRTLNLDGDQQADRKVHGGVVGSGTAALEPRSRSRRSRSAPSASSTSTVQL